MPKRRTKSSRRNVDDTNTLIQHHLEEAAVHLGMVKQLVENHPTHDQDTKDALFNACRKMGKRIKKMYVIHGGHPDA
jgi:hypothetical protein